MGFLRPPITPPPDKPSGGRVVQAVTPHHLRGGFNCARHIDRFLEGLFGVRQVSFSRFGEREVTAFVQRTARQHSAPYTKQVVTALRSFLRYLHYRGHVGSDLSSAVPRVAHLRMSALPKHLPADAVQRVLEACERTSAVGRRNFAIPLLLARLGLRAGEIVALQLGDIDWESAPLTVRSSKGGGWAQRRYPQTWVKPSRSIWKVGFSAFPHSSR